MWVIWEGSRGDYESYADFNKSFDPKTKIFNKIWTTIKSDLSTEINGLIKSKNPFRLDSASPFYKNMRIDPTKKAEYFAYLSEGQSARSNTAALNTKATLHNKNINKEDLLEESERKLKSRLR